MGGETFSAFEEGLIFGVVLMAIIFGLMRWLEARHKRKTNSGEEQ